MASCCSLSLNFFHSRCALAMFSLAVSYTHLDVYKRQTTNYVIDMTDYIRKDNEMFSFTSRVKDNIGASSMVDLSLIHI